MKGIKQNLVLGIKKEKAEATHVASALKGGDDEKELQQSFLN